MDSHVMYAYLMENLRLVEEIDIFNSTDVPLRN